MADQVNNGNGLDSTINTSFAQYLETMSMTNEEVLRSIDLTLKSIAKRDGLIISQSSLKDLATQEQQAFGRINRQPNNSARTERISNRSVRSTINEPTSRYNRKLNSDWEWDTRNAKQSFSRMFDKMTDQFEDEFFKALVGSANPLKDALTKSVMSFANSLGTDVNGLGKELGKRAGQLVKDINFKWGNGTVNVGDMLSSQTSQFNTALSSLLDSNLSALSKRLGGTGKVDSSIVSTQQWNAQFNSQPTSQANIQTILDSIDNTTNDNVVATQEAADTIISETHDSIISAVQDIDEVFSQGMQQLNENVDRIYNQLAGSPSSEDLAETNPQDIADMVASNTNVQDATSAARDAADIVSQASEMGQAASNIAEMGQAAGRAATGASQLAPTLAEVGAGASGAAVAFPPLAVALAVLPILLEELSEAIGPAIEGFQSMEKSFKNAANRTLTENTQLLAEQKKRIESDRKAVVEAAMSVIQDSAKKVESVWDEVLTTITATQGYDKAQMQNLWSSYAKRLQQDQLDKYVSSADIMENLKTILQKGLSGQIAEAFAYQATVLSNAVPTEDFFQYAETYASLAANAIKNGASQAEAIDLANQELNQFASNVLYASRQISGGLTTSLVNASSLFEQSAKIALTSRTGDLSDISGVLTSVSALVGSIAPDVASSLVDAVVSAATGGNSSEITALRSMAGVGASNTAFLQAFASNPQAIFETLFRNLAQLQNMSSSNYMEVAEALSSTFGLSMDAFARVDFNYLADAISQMNINNASLEENIAMLTSGQTTSNESQLRMQKINEYMIDQGLAYVLDNEVARSIQEHMWDQQLAEQITQATYAVDLTGGALDLLNGIITSIGNILSIINPLSGLVKVADLTLTALQDNKQNSDIAKLVEAGKVGVGDEAIRNRLLNTYNVSKDFQSYTDLMGIGSSMSLPNSVGQVGRNIASSLLSGIRSAFSNTSSIRGDYSLREHSGGGGNDNGSTPTGKSVIDAYSSSTSLGSYYTRAIVSKTAANILSSGDWRDAYGYNATWQNYAQSGTDQSGPRTAAQAATLSSSIQSSMQKYLTKTDDTITLLNTMAQERRDNPYMTQSELTDVVSNQLKSGAFDRGSFEEWVQAFQEENGIQNLRAELDNYGATLEQLQALYAQSESARIAASTKARELHEVQFWEDMQHFATIDFPEYLTEWKRYYIEHEAYTRDTNEAYRTAMTLDAEEKGELGDSVLALARSLTENNMWQQEIKDPVVQTNALLAKILITVEAIMQQNNETSIVSVPTALSSLGLGVANK